MRGPGTSGPGWHLQHAAKASALRACGGQEHLVICSAVSAFGGCSGGSCSQCMRGLQRGQVQSVHGGAAAGADAVSACGSRSGGRCSQCMRGLQRGQVQSAHKEGVHTVRPQQVGAAGCREHCLCWEHCLGALSGSTVCAVAYFVKSECMQACSVYAAGRPQEAGVQSSRAGAPLEVTL